MVHQQLHVIQNTAHRPSTQASYTASRVRPKEENQLCSGANCSNTHNIISSMAPHEFNVILRTTTDEFNVIPRTKISTYLNSTSFIWYESKSVTIMSWRHDTKNQICHHFVLKPYLGKVTKRNFLHFGYLQNGMENSALGVKNNSHMT